MVVPNNRIMKVEQLSLTEANWSELLASITIDANLFLLFVSPEFRLKQEVLAILNKNFPKATIVGCSTAGEISDVTVKDNNCSYNAGQKIANQLYSKDLKHVLVLSDGLNVNGADLVSGLKLKLPDVSITGGLAADGADFNKTFIINDNEITDRTIIGLGFYGADLKVGYSSKGGWDSFGIERLVTKSDKNVLYELDGLRALELYKSFLGEEANNLPSSGLLFPLSMRNNDNSTPVVRTILAINEEVQSLTFAGNIPQGSYVRLMKANIDRLIDGAEESAHLELLKISRSDFLSCLFKSLW